MAGCCKPIQGDEIIGYLTHGRGITVHRIMCPNFMHLSSKSPNRVLDVEWGNKKDIRHQQVNLLLFCRDVEMAIHEVTTIINANKISIVTLHPSYSKKHKNIKLSIILNNIQVLETLIKKINATSCIKSVIRV